MTYDDWLIAFEAEATRRLGNEAGALPWMPYEDMYDDGLTPEKAVQEAYAHMHGKETYYSGE